MLPNVNETLKRSFKISTTVSSCVLWVCFIWCDSFSSQVVIAVAFGTVCFFFFCISSLNTRTCSQKYTSIYVHMHRQRQIQSDSALCSTCLISFQSSSTVLFSYLKCLKPSFPRFFFCCKGAKPLTKLGKLNCLGWAPPPWITLSWMSFWRSGGQLIH